MPSRGLPLLALTCGDPAGVGPEIIAAWLKAHPRGAGSAAIIGPARWLKSLPAAAAKIPVGLEKFVVRPGKPTGEGALVAWAALERAAAGCKAGEFAGVVTGPVSKAGLASIGYEFPGQTEFFAARWGGAPTMGFCGGRLRVVLLTWHIPLREVPAHLTEANFTRTVRAADELARADGVVKPRLAVCGLNPHEEAGIINPILAKLQAAYPGLTLCEPADTLFARELRHECDVVIALYHDQGLAPLKAVDFDTAVNVTLGLPHVRTSPDHGTAFRIAARGVASPRSFANAVKVARRLLAWRASRGDPVGAAKS